VGEGWDFFELLIPVGSSSQMDGLHPTGPANTLMICRYPAPTPVELLSVKQGCFVLQGWTPSRWFIELGAFFPVLPNKNWGKNERMTFRGTLALVYHYRRFDLLSPSSWCLYYNYLCLRMYLITLSFGWLPRGQEAGQGCSAGRNGTCGAGSIDNMLGSLDNESFLAWYLWPSFASIAIRKETSRFTSQLMGWDPLDARKHETVWAHFRLLSKGLRKITGQENLN